jgi:hypothetical protein
MHPAGDVQTPVLFVHHPEYDAMLYVLVPPAAARRYEEMFDD